MKIRRRLELVAGDLGGCRNLKRRGTGYKIVLAVFDGG
jgi:hypothetical protein